MSEAIFTIRAECRSCGWLGMGDERKARRDATVALLCPECSGQTRSWIVDLSKEMADMDRVKGEYTQSLGQSNDTCQQSHFAYKRLHDARRATERARHRVAMLDPDDRSYSAAKAAFITAQQQEAEASLACDQAEAAIKRLG